MLRTLKRWFSTEEVKHLGTELDRLRELFSDLGHKLEGLEIKHDRLSNKYRMRDARELRHGRGGMQLGEEEREILADLRSGEAEVVSTRGDPFS